MIPITKPHVGAEEWRAVAAVLRSGWLTQGPVVAQFERRVAEYCEVAEAVAVSSGTAALHVALAALGIGPGDEVICPSMSFIATTSAVRHAGAEPVFADVDPETFNLDPDAVERAVSPRTKAVLVVHQIGVPAELDRLVDLGRRRGLLVLEDAACALGSRYRGRPIGGHTEAACFSFHPRKVITTGEGGMITTNRPELAERLRLLRNHGATAAASTRQAEGRTAPSEYACAGYNFRMSDLHAAVGVEQMKRLDTILLRRRWAAARYREALRGHPWLRAPNVPRHVEPNYQSFALLLSEDAPMSREELLRRLNEAGIAAREGIMLAHRQPPYRHVRGADDLPNSEAAHARSILLPLYPQMLRRDIQCVAGFLWSLASIVPEGPRRG